MNIVACMKWVPDTHDVKVDPVTNALIREGVKHIINPFDENAIEAGLQLKEKLGGMLTVICMGPKQAEEGLRTAIAMGADDAILLSDAAFRGSDTLATSNALAGAVRKIADYDLILCGKQAIDGDTAQVPAGLAERLGIPQVTLAIGIEPGDNPKRLKVKRVTDDAYELIEVRLPAVVSVVKQINEPRFPAMKGVLKAKKFPIKTWGIAEIELDPEIVGFAGSPTWVSRTFVPARHSRGQMLAGETSDVVSELTKILTGLNLGAG
jgi:electron transfer flavoprotein alpha/beta subunit